MRWLFFRRLQVVDRGDEIMPIRIQTEDFELATELAQLRHANLQIGAIVSFIGTVRDMNEGSVIEQMVLEHYPEMTEKVLNAIVLQAKARWYIDDVLVIHRVGPLRPSDQIVLVIVTSVHRSAAFAACEFIIDYLKTEAPFWKKEHTSQGARWVNARVTDSAALNKWQQDTVLTTAGKNAQ